jgi:thiamine-monophosphate kinase
MGDMAWDEDDLHRWMGKHLDAPLGARGHDAFVLQTSSRTAVCVDACVEGVHFLASARPVAIGRKAAGRPLSDLAATAAKPQGLWLALRAPREAHSRHLRAIMRELDRAGRAYGAPLLGGDLTSAPGPLGLTVTAVGRVLGTQRAPHRSRARKGQAVLLTGPVGGALLGRHLTLEPRLAEGRWLHEEGATALMDVSDGLARDAFRLARAAGVRIDLDLESIPLHGDARRAARQDRRTALDHALRDGEDHELIATVPRTSVARLLRACRRRCPGLTQIGTVRPGSGLWLGVGTDMHRWDERGGWTHGS